MNIIKIKSRTNKLLTLIGMLLILLNYGCASGKTSEESRIYLVSKPYSLVTNINSINLGYYSKDKAIAITVYTLYNNKQHKKQSLIDIYLLPQNNCQPTVSFVSYLDNYLTVNTKKIYNSIVSLKQDRASIYLPSIGTSKLVKSNELYLKDYKENIQNAAAKYQYINAVSSSQDSGYIVELLKKQEVVNIYSSSADALYSINANNLFSSNYSVKSTGNLFVAQYNKALSMCKAIKQ